jgi:hypothetical protein
MTPSSTAPTAPARPLTGNSQISDYSSSAQGHGRTPLTPPASSIKYNTTPNVQNGNQQHDDLEVDEVGALQSHQSRMPGTIDHPGYGSSAQIPMGSIQEDSALVARPVGGSSRRRRGSATAVTQSRLTITNISDRDAEVREAVEQAQTIARQQQPTTPPMRNQRSWLSAEEEKRKLYESARAKVEQVQGSAVMAPQSSEAVSRSWLASQFPPANLPCSPHNRKVLLHSVLPGQQQKRRKFVCSTKPKPLPNALKHLVPQATAERVRKPMALLDSRNTLVA